MKLREKDVFLRRVIDLVVLHQTKQSGQNSCPLLAEVAFPRLLSEVKIALFLFESRYFLANNFYFLVKFINKANRNGNGIRMSETCFIK
jgi:hypothetical protein